MRLNDAGDGSINHRHQNGLQGLVFIDNLLALLIDNFTLFTHHIIILQRVFTRVVVIPFDTLLC